MQRDQLTELYLMQLPALRKFASYYFSSSVDVEDVLQNVFLKAWEHCEALREEQLFMAWIQQIVRNESLTLLRKRRRMSEVLTEDLNDTPESGSMEDMLLTKLALWDMLAQINESLARPVYLHYLAGYSICEVAVLLQRPDGTVKSMLHRARKLLYQCRSA